MDTSSVIRKIKAANDSPLEFDELVEAWNSLCEQAWTEKSDDFQFADIENAALAALSADSDQSPSGQVGYDISRMLSSFDYPTYLVTVDGRVAAANTAASMEFDLDIGKPIDQLPYALDGAQPISALIRDNMDEEKEIDADAILKRAYAATDEKIATIALTPSFGRVPMALVFVVTTQWKPKSAGLLNQQFGLTDTESEVLISFVDGYSSQDIAKQRARSHATIRTQFQSILNKTGTRNQTELLRTVLSISDFSKNIGEIVNAVNHPHRRCAEVLRKGGRVIEVTLMGDFAGDVVLTVGGVAFYTFDSKTERLLFEANICVVSVCTPGCGKTDPIPENADRLEFIVDDVRTVLDQLEVDQCPILAIRNSPPICYKIASVLPDRISHIAQVSGCVPVKYTVSHLTQSSWVNGIAQAGMQSSAMKKILLKGAIKAWSMVGSKHFFRLQMSSNPIDSRYLQQADVIKESDHALKTATMSGLSYATEDAGYTFGDWSEEVENCGVKTTILSGVEDSLFNIDAIRAFAKDFSKCVELIEVEDAGFTLIDSHPRKVVSLLRSIVNKQSDSLKAARSVTQETHVH